MQSNKVKSIHEWDQSIWIDFFDRNLMNEGILKQLIENDGIRGVTSNPSIFAKAISNSTDYNEDIKILSRQKNNNNDIFWGLAIKDIQRAADIFKPVYEESKGTDGFVSLEVSPELAHNTDGTIQQAMKLWKALERKNVMIKIPSTKEGLPAIKKCVSEGLNINITLLFGLPRYREVVEAYISGLEDRLKINKPIDHIASVASFFLSRIDVLVDPMLEERGLGILKGEVAIASAKKAYEIYKNVFNEERFKKLEEKGAKRQHLLWASTSSKNPAFSDIKYVEALIGPKTINTIPLKTLEAFRDHGKAENRLESDLDKATDILLQLKDKGIDINSITQNLEEDGVKKFNKSYEKILEAIENKKRNVLV
jgi:transaldolase/transaldolase/glucose-6-phosphate isomerase